MGLRQTALSLGQVGPGHDQILGRQTARLDQGRHRSDPFLGPGTRTLGNFYLKAGNTTVGGFVAATPGLAADQDLGPGTQGRQFRDLALALSFGFQASANVTGAGTFQGQGSVIAATTNVVDIEGQ